MRTRWLATCGVGLLVAATALAQSPGGDERPTQLPPLLPVPGPVAPLPPAPPAPPGPRIEYDPGHFYLPERSPEIVQVVEYAPANRWWGNLSLELAWVSSHPAPQALRLRPPDLFGRRVRGLNVPLGGEAADPFHVGLGLSLGRWFGDQQLHAVEANLFLLPGNPRTFDGFAPGTLVVFPDGPDRSAPMFLRVPGVATSFPVTASTWFAGTDVNYRGRLLVTTSVWLDFLAGYRFLYLEDELYLGESPEDGRTEYERNRLAVSNAFHGGQLGLAGTWQSPTWYTEGALKLAFGGVTTHSCATGAFLYSTPTAHVRTDTHSAFLPTLNVRLGYRLSDRGRVYAGYSFQYLTRAGRLGDAFDRDDGALTASDLWVQALGLGFEWRF
jgi:hypothetical protein